MPSSILNSDDGVISGTAGLKNSGGDDAVLLIQTKGVTAQTVDAGQRTMFPTTIGVGGATPSTSGSGISFPASASASTNANTLDDYEEGTWTPSYSQGVTSPVHTSTGGLYKKVGALVFVTGRIQLSSGTGNASQILIAGLPFANVTSTFADAAISVAFNGGFKTDGAFTMIVGTNSTSIDFYTFSGSNFSGLAATNVQAILTFSGCYQV